MTASTAWIPSVRAGIIPLGVMAEVGRRPAVGGMAHVALLGCQQMRGYHFITLCAATRAVAGVTVVDTAGIVRPGAASEGCGGVTG